VFCNRVVLYDHRGSAGVGARVFIPPKGSLAPYRIRIVLYRIHIVLYFWRKIFKTRWIKDFAAFVMIKQKLQKGTIDLAQSHPELVVISQGAVLQWLTELRQIRPTNLK
jgi:hypothetical protein